MQLVGYLSRAYSRSKCSDPRAQFSVRNAIGHLETHFDQPVNLNELSRLSQMSKRSFIRAFQAATGGHADRLSGDAATGTRRGNAAAPRGERNFRRL